MLTVQPESTLIDFKKFEAKLSELQHNYQQNLPFPHIKIENFLSDFEIKKIAKAFPPSASPHWMHYKHYNEKKLGQKNLELMPTEIRRLIEELLSDRFTDFLSQLTGIKNLKADRSLEGGGLHQIGSGGFLNIHADFTSHHRIPNLRRRINFLLYLNPNWQTEWNGQLELWDKSMSACEAKYEPLLNHAIIFTTDVDTFHGHPDPLTCPDTVTRNSIALYYFTEDSEAARLAKSTNYQPRPSDPWLKKLFIAIDRTLVHIYSRGKAKLNISDEFTGQVLKLFNDWNKLWFATKK